jgi:hypothetical protein
MVFYDPLGKYGFPFLNAEVAQFSVKYGYRALPFHFHEVLLSLASYNLIFLLSQLILPRVWKTYTAMSPRTQLNFCIHVVSMVQCIVIMVLSYPLFDDQTLSKDRVGGYTPYCGFVCAMALGYFIWDSYICLRHIRLFGPGFVLHGLGSFFVFLQSMRPYVMYYTPIFLLFEASTPFVNIHWFATHLPEGTVPQWVQAINAVFLLITFFAARLVWGIYQAYRLFSDVFGDNLTFDYPAWVHYCTLVSNVSLTLLNMFWFRKMIKLAVRRIRAALRSFRSHKKVD